VENVEHFAELAQLVDERDMGKYVQFLRSPSDDVKLALLRRACAVIYTPDNEHFGIVPLESMYSGATYKKIIRCMLVCRHAVRGSREWRPDGDSR
jgi:glycosyltransferase involved in cell wall biosynthesis